MKPLPVLTLGSILAGVSADVGSQTFDRIRSTAGSTAGSATCLRVGIIAAVSSDVWLQTFDLRYSTEDVHLETFDHGRST